LPSALTSSPSGHELTLLACGSSSCAAAPSRAFGRAIGSVSVALPDAGSTSNTWTTSPFAPFSPFPESPSAGTPDT
jgi:hypothetical protein